MYIIALVVSETSPPPDGYLPMKPGFTTVCGNYMSMEGHGNSKQGNFCNILFLVYLYYI